jgi:hypothetical protein
MSVAESFGKTAQETIARYASEDPEYWIYHSGRSLAFAVQGLLSLSAFELKQILINNPIPSQSSMSFEKAGRAGSRMFTEALLVFRQDFENIKEGHYKRPWDMEAKRGNRSWNPLFIIDSHFRYMRNALSTLEKRRKSASESVPTNVWMNGSSALYPDYYLNTFHFQASARLSKIVTLRG